MNIVVFFSWCKTNTVCSTWLKIFKISKERRLLSIINLSSCVRSKNKILNFWRCSNDRFLNFLSMCLYLIPKSFFNLSSFWKVMFYRLKLYFWIYISKHSKKLVSFGKLKNSMNLNTFCYFIIAVTVLNSLYLQYNPTSLPLNWSS